MTSELLAQLGDLASNPGTQLTIQGIGAAGVGWVINALIRLDRRLYRIELRLKIDPDKP